MKRILNYTLIIIILLASCREDDDIVDEVIPPNNPEVKSDPTPYALEIPPHFNRINYPNIPIDNPMTVEGVALGKKLFFEKMLSKDNSISCGSCHAPSEAFNDRGMVKSLGVGGTQSIRNAMPLFNLAWGSVTSRRFNWHGSVTTLEEQALGPVRDPLEMQETWINVASKLQGTNEYPQLFEKAFGTNIIDSNLVVKAIAQFERTLISGDSKFDRYFLENFESIDLPGDNDLTAQEQRGFNIYVAEEKGDCFHCHGSQFQILWTTNEFINNGLDANPDSGLAWITKNPLDVGKFKTPSLRNLAFTAPYMHDGRFATLEEVVEFYNSGVNANSPNIDGRQKARNMNAQEKQDLIAFLNTLNDTSFVTNPAFRP
jgi:cytochrome c peroxidase